MITKIDRKAERIRRHIRVRRKISGTTERPRLCVYRSNKNLFVQVIDDVNQVTLAQASTLDKEVKTKHANKEAAKEVGALIAKRALEKEKELRNILSEEQTRCFEELFELTSQIHFLEVKDAFFSACKLGAKASKEFIT